MDILKPIVRNFTYDFFSRRDGIDIREYHNELNQSQFYSLDELETIQLQKLKKLLTFCYEHNQFYRKRFEDCHFHPNDFSHISMLKLLPVLTKDDIREASDALFSDRFNRDNTVHKRTGGSTGIPIHNYWDKPAAVFKRTGTRRHNEWAKLIPGVRMACVWGDTDKKQSLKERTRNALYERAFYLDTLRFDKEHIESFISQIRKLNPEILMGHAHSVYRLAEYIQDNNIQSFQFEGIVTSAMVLTVAERNTIESVFNSPVFDRYGCEELGMIASECEAHDGKHIFVEGLYLEIEESSYLETGELIITDLVNYAMPMLRYRIGDCGVLSTGVCSCGRSLPRLMEVSGRTADFLYRPDGTPVFGISILDTFVIHIAGLKQVQIIQDRYDHLDFLVVRDNAFSDESLSQLQKNVIDIFGAAMTYDIQYVESIPQTRAGKFRFSICNIDKEKKP